MATDVQFAGFPEILPSAGDGKNFFHELSANNNREWFQANKGRFQTEWHDPMTALLGHLRESLDDSYPDLELADPKIFRLNRDVRFSKDKAPYKTNIGGFLPVARGGSPSPSSPAALYIQYGAEASFVAAGIYGLEPAALARFRAAVADDRGAELEKLVNPLTKAGWTIGAVDALKKVPKGFDADHPRGEWLKKKGFILSPPASLVGAADTSLAKRLTKIGKDAAPIVRWLTFATA